METSNAFLRPRRLSIQMVSIWAGCTFRFVATMYLNFDSFNKLLKFRLEHRLPPRGVFVAFLDFLTSLYVGVNVCVRVTVSSVLHLLQPASDSLKSYSANFRRAAPTDGWT